MLCPLVFVGTINDEDCDLQGPSSVAGSLAGWPPFRAALRPRSNRTQRDYVLVACALHCGNMEQISASSVRVGARTHIELTWPNGPMAAVGHVHHNNKSVHCLNHSGGDNHPKRAARCGSHASLNERHLCWHSDPSLDRERHKGARCHSHLRPHGEAEKTVGSQAVMCRHFCLGLQLKWSKIVTDMSTSYVSSRPKEGVKESPRPIDGLSIGLSIGDR